MLRSIPKSMTNLIEVSHLSFFSGTVTYLLKYLSHNFPVEFPFVTRINIYWQFANSANLASCIQILNDSMKQTLIWVVDCGSFVNNAKSERWSSEMHFWNEISESIEKDIRKF